MKHIIITAITILAFVTNNLALDNPKREFRGAWLHVIGQTQWQNKTTAQAKEYIVDQIDKLQRAGCNAVIFQVRPTADAVYKSDLEPWSAWLTGKRGKAPNPLWDPMEFAIQEAHKRGWSFPWALDAEGHSITAPGGETYEHALARVQSLLDDLESVRGRTVLLTHGGISRSILRAIYGTPADRFWRIQISNVSSFVLSYDGKRYFLAALGLTPEEVKRRVEEDVVKDLDNWDGDAK